MNLILYNKNALSLTFFQNINFMTFNLDHVLKA